MSSYREMLAKAQADKAARVRMGGFGTHGDLFEGPATNVGEAEWWGAEQNPEQAAQDKADYQQKLERHDRRDEVLDYRRSRDSQTIINRRATALAYAMELRQFNMDDSDAHDVVATARVFDDFLYGDPS